MLIKGSRVCEYQYERISHKPFIFSIFFGGYILCNAKVMYLMNSLKAAVYFFTSTEGSPFKEKEAEL